jgi:peptide/nickel transport system substrate-binding protein
MHRSTLWLAVVAGLAAVSLMAVGTAGGASNGASAGSVVFGAEQEPPCLNGFLEGCNNTWTSWTAGVALASIYIVKPNFALSPYMGSGKVLKKKPFTLLVKINKKAKWSDGKPVSADDLIFTWKTIVNPQWELAGTSGWDSISTAKKVNGKTVRFVFKKAYAPWKVMLATSVLPQHALAGENFNEVWNSNYNNKSGVSMASGPMKLSNYTKGQSLTMVRNSSFFGKKPKLDKITFRFITVTDSEIQAIRGGEVDMIYPQPQLQLAGLRGLSGLGIQSNAGSTLEHLDINAGSKSSNPLLGQRWFRQAIAYSLDRNAMVQQLFRTLNPRLKVLNNLTFTNQQNGYVAHFAKYTRNLNKVNSLFRAHNCSKGGDGIWSCGGQRASVRLGTTAGNRLRELAVEIMQAQAKSAGIEFRADNSPSRLFFPRVSDQNYDIALFAWVGTGDPAGQVDIYGCADPKTADNPTGAGGSNWKAYCNAKVTALLKKSDAELNPKARIKENNQADQILSNDAISIPLYQKPTYFVYKTKVKGLKDNPTLQGPTWNTEAWSTS